MLATSNVLRLNPQPTHVHYVHAFACGNKGRAEQIIDAAVAACTCIVKCLPQAATRKRHVVCASVAGRR